MKDLVKTQSSLPETFLVSIIMPAFNSARFISDAIESVVFQTYTNWELLIVDDHSSDETTKVVEQYVHKDGRIKLTSNRTNLGSAKSRNKALAMARGRFLAFLDSDDRWRSDKLHLQLHFMQQSRCGFSFTAYQIVNEQAVPSGQIVDMNCPDRVSYRDMLNKRATLGCSTVVIDKDKTGDLVMPDLRTGQDYALWLKLLRSGHEAFRLDRVLTDYRITPNSISRNKFKKARRQWQIYRSVEGLGMIASISHFANYAWRAVFRA